VSGLIQHVRYLLQWMQSNLTNLFVDHSNSPLAVNFFKIDALSIQ
jgi:hypothetical protein